MVTGGYKDNTLLLYIATGDGERAAAGCAVRDQACPPRERLPTGRTLKIYYSIRLAFLPKQVLSFGRVHLFCHTFSF